MLIEKGDASGVDAQTFPDAVAEDEARVEYRHHGFRPRFQFSVDVNLDIAIARVVDEFVRALGHGWQPEADGRQMVAIPRANVAFSIASAAATWQYPFRQKLQEPAGIRRPVCDMSTRTFQT